MNFHSFLNCPFKYLWYYDIVWNKQDRRLSVFKVLSHFILHLCYFNKCLNGIIGIVAFYFIYIYAVGQDEYFPIIPHPNAQSWILISNEGQIWTDRSTEISKTHKDPKQTNDQYLCDRSHGMFVYHLSKINFVCDHHNRHKHRSLTV